MQYFHLIFTKPGNVIIVHPCIFLSVLIRKIKENFGRLMDIFHSILIVSQFPNYSALDNQSFSSTLFLNISERERLAEVGFKCYVAARSSIF